MPIYRVVYQYMNEYQIDVKAEDEDGAVDAVENIFSHFQPCDSYGWGSEIKEEWDDDDPDAPEPEWEVI